VNGLFVRAVVAFLVLPGLVAFAIPLLLIAPLARGFDSFGLVALIPGLAVLLLTVREFYVAGRGTLAPWSPPRTLVTSGLYRYSRNPMYIGVLLILAGWAIAFRSWSLALYAEGVAIAVHFRVVLYEEPFLARTHPAAWELYKSRVRRWLGF
jgi:protein-S-isoprenylcysteine O-methyltransferase Ste14